MNASRILILSSNTGGGHRTAALTLRESLMDFAGSSYALSLEVAITQVLEEATWITRQMANLYNWLLRHRQDWMKYYYSMIHRLKPNEHHWVFRKALPYGRRILEATLPQLIISVHPMTQHFFSFLLREFHLQQRIPLVTVVTDPIANFWRGWACPDVSLYCVASESARNELIRFGVDPHRIQITGMPIHSRFQAPSPHDKMAHRLGLGLDPHKTTLLLNAGWIGGGNVPAMFEALLAADGMDFSQLQTVFITGQNTALTQWAQAQTADHPMQTVVVPGRQADMLHLMQASDLMVSKLGGLTTFEALACHLPIMADAITPPMPQEAATFHWAESQGISVLVRTAEGFTDQLQTFIENPATLSRFQHRCASLQAANGSEKIVRALMERYGQLLGPHGGGIGEVPPLLTVPSVLASR